MKDIVPKIVKNAFILASTDTESANGEIVDYATELVNAHSLGKTENIQVAVLILRSLLVGMGHMDNIDVDLDAIESKLIRQYGKRRFEWPVDSDMNYFQLAKEQLHIST